jgi:hypothetical protein
MWARKASAAATSAAVLAALGGLGRGDQHVFDLGCWWWETSSPRRQPDLFAHWRFGVRPDGWTMGAR